MLEQTPGSATRCPECGAQHECATVLDRDSGPAVRSLAACIRCGAIAVFGEGLQLELMKASEFAALPEVVRTQLETLRKAIRER